MGPIRKDFTDKYGDNWSAGRIEVYDSNTLTFYADDEYSTGFIDSDDWHELDDFLWDLNTDTQYTREELYQAFIKHRGRPMMCLLPEKDHYREMVLDELTQLSQDLGMYD